MQTTTEPTHLPETPTLQTYDNKRAILDQIQRLQDAEETDSYSPDDRAQGANRATNLRAVPEVNADGEETGRYYLLGNDRQRPHVLAECADGYWRDLD